MSTTLDSDFLRAIVLVTGFRGNAMQGAQAALLMIGLRGQDFCAGQLPKEVCSDNKHLAGCATGALVAIGLLEVVGRVKSPNPDAKSRKMNLLRIPNDKVSTARTWLRVHGYEPKDAQADQLALQIA